METAKKITDRIVGGIVLLLILSFFGWGVKVAAAVIATAPVWGPWLAIRAAVKRRRRAQDPHGDDETEGPEGEEGRVPPVPPNPPLTTYEGFRVFPIPPLD